MTHTMRGRQSTSSGVTTFCSCGLAFFTQFSMRGFRRFETSEEREAAREESDALWTAHRDAEDGPFIVKYVNPTPDYCGALTPHGPHEFWADLDGGRNTNAPGLMCMGLTQDVTETQPIPIQGEEIFGERGR